MKSPFPLNICKNINPMMKLIIAFFIICTSLNSNAQSKKKLETIANKLSSFQNYQTICEFSFSLPFGDTLTFESLVVLQKVPANNICGFNYNFNVLEKYRGETFGEFSVYFDSTVYNSYKGVVEKISYVESPSQFMDLELEKGIAPAIQRRHVLYYVTPYQLSEEIENIIADTTMIISQEPDTLIDRDTCYRFIVESKDTRFMLDSSTLTKIESKQTIELCFNKSSFYPVYYKNKTRDDMVNSLQIASFKDTKTNFNLSKNYFSEDNLLPKGRKTDDGMPEKKKSFNLLGKKAPKWNLPVLSKNEYYSSDSIQGKYAILEFTATWCSHCWEAAKMMNRLEVKYENNENIELLSIYSSKQDNEESIKRFVEKLKTKSTILYSASSVSKEYGVMGYPQFFIISPGGEVIKYIKGYGSSIENDIIDAISKFTE